MRHIRGGRTGITPVFLLSGDTPDLLPYKAWFVSHEAETLPPLGKDFDARILEHISEDRKLITTFGTLFKSITHLIHKIMGTNMKKAFTTLLCLLFCITISAQDKAADLSRRLVLLCPRRSVWISRWKFSDKARERQVDR